MIFLTGSTGFIGRHLLPRLKEKGHSIRCFVRRDSNTGILGNACAEKMIGDVMDESSLRYSMKGIGTVIHLAGMKVESMGSSFEGNIYLGARHVIDAAKASGVKHFIFMSAFGADFKAKSKFNHFKWLSEEYLRFSGLSYTILRPTLVFGPQDHFVTRWVSALKRFPLLPVLGSKKHLLQPIFISDVVQCILKVLENPEKHEAIYELGGPDQLTYDQILHEIGEMTGYRRSFFHLPEPLVKTVAFFSEMFLSDPPMTKDEIVRWAESRICDPQVIENTFGFKLTSFRAGLMQCFEKHEKEISRKL